MHTGIDIGLGVTSIIALDDNGKVLQTCRFGTKIDKKTLGKLKENKPLLRYNAHAERLFHYCNIHSLGTVIMENPQTKTMGNGLRIYTLRGTYLVVLNRFIKDDKLKNPVAGTIKKFWTGSGRASKEEMIAEAQRRGYGVLDEHDADATAMARMSIDHTWDGDK